MSNKDQTILRSFRYAFPKTIPIMTGFLFLGISYGMMMGLDGFPFYYPLSMSIVIFGGSLEFVAASWLLSAFDPLQTFLLSLFIQARHLFYGIAMIDKYKGLGWKKPYLIYALCDETFSINCSLTIPDTVDRGWTYFFVSLLDYLYWVIGATLGGLFGSLISVKIQGLDFVMTAMFVVILIDQLKKEKQTYTALIGGVSALVCLLLFGADRFLLPTLICILFLLSIFKKPLEKKLQGGKLL